MASVDIVSLDPKAEEFSLPAGTVCHRNGIPFELAADALIRCHGANWPLLSEGIDPPKEPAHG